MSDVRIDLTKLNFLWIHPIYMFFFMSEVFCVTPTPLTQLFPDEKLPFTAAYELVHFRTRPPDDIFNGTLSSDA